MCQKRHSWVQDDSCCKMKCLDQATIMSRTKRICKRAQMVYISPKALLFLGQSEHNQFHHPSESVLTFKFPERARSSIGSLSGPTRCSCSETQLSHLPFYPQLVTPPSPVSVPGASNGEFLSLT